MNRRNALGLLAAGLALTACGGGNRAPSAAGGSNVLSVARSNGMTRFVRAVDAAGMTEVLSGPGPYTLFAPTDRAVAASNLGRLDGEDLQRVLAYHIVPGLLTDDFLEGIDVNHTTLLGSSVNTDGTGAALTVNGAGVVRANLPASNGVVYSIDRVLAPR
jgi:uncharacterized surface protein with fasciclin (FAS1) repeats